jgi:hypothetical protein
MGAERRQIRRMRRLPLLAGLLLHCLPPLLTVCTPSLFPGRC